MISVNDDEFRNGSTCVIDNKVYVDSSSNSDGGERTSSRKKRA